MGAGLLVVWSASAVFAAMILVITFSLAELRVESGTRAAVRRWFFPRRGDRAPNAFRTFGGVFDALYGRSVLAPRFFLASAFTTFLAATLAGMFFSGLDWFTPADADGAQGLFGLLKAFRASGGSVQTAPLALGLVLIKLILDAAGLALTRSLVGIAGVMRWISLLFLPVIGAVALALFGVTLIVANWMIVQAGLDGLPALGVDRLMEIIGAPQAYGQSLYETALGLMTTIEPRGLDALVKITLATQLFPLAWLILFLLSGTVGRLFFSSHEGESRIGRAVEAERKPITALAYAGVFVIACIYVLLIPVVLA